MLKLGEHLNTCCNTEIHWTNKCLTCVKNSSGTLESDFKNFYFHQNQPDSKCTRDKAGKWLNTEEWEEPLLHFSLQIAGQTNFSSLSK